MGLRRLVRGKRQGWPRSLQSRAREQARARRRGRARSPLRRRSAAKPAASRRPSARTPSCAASTWRSPRARFAVLVGSSGCGKSTLLRLVAGLETARRWHDPPRRARRDPARAARSRRRHGLPELRALPAPLGEGQPRLRAASCAARRAAEIETRIREASTMLGPRRAARAAPQAALRRAAAARRHGSRHRAPSDDVPLRRAALEPRRGPARRGARRDPPPPRSPRRDHALRHPRSGRGDDPRRHAVGDEQGPRRAEGPAPRGLRPPATRRSSRPSSARPP